VGEGMDQWISNDRNNKGTKVLPVLYFILYLTIISFFCSKFPFKTVTNKNVITHYSSSAAAAGECFLCSANRLKRTIAVLPLTKQQMSREKSGALKTKL
jgi:hypothetical protein